MKINSSPILKVIIATGGTGGHIFPALAVANELKEKYPNVEILFIGANNKMEMQKIPQAGYKIIGLDIAGWNRYNIFKNITLIFKFIKSFYRAYKILNQFQPKVVIGFGGYASFMALRVAQFLNIPTLIHEQNSLAGKSNKILAKRAKKVFVAYENMERFFDKNKIQYIGNPLRKNIYQFHQIKGTEALDYFKLNPKQNSKTILVIGGSLGSQSMNETVYANLDFFINNKCNLIWQCGKGYSNYHKIKNKKYDSIRIMEFIDNIEFAYAAASVIIARAGALTVSELAFVGKPVIFIPFPYAAEDHQTYNAMALVNKNAALIVKDIELQALLIPVLSNLLKNERLLVSLGENIRKTKMLDASNKIVQEILLQCNKSEVNIEKLKSVYILGIGGAGISALARYCLTQKIKVFGYDKTKTELSQQLEKEGVLITYSDSSINHKMTYDLVIYTPSVPIHLKLFQNFIKSQLPIIKRSQFLGKITNNGFNICIAGTHGKTSISTLMAHVLKNHPLGCNAYLGGISLNYNNNFWINPNSKINVIEADEYDRSFLQLSPNMIVLTSLDSDHLDIYQTHENMIDAYFQFLNKQKENGFVILQHDLSLKYDFSSYRYLTYSITKSEANFYASNIQIEENTILFDVYFNRQFLENFKLENSSLYNIENSLPVIAVNKLLEMNLQDIKQSIVEFKGVKRRFQFISKNNTTTYIDDYAHHPKELQVLIESVKKMYVNKKICVVFQPHLFSRTKNYAQEFADSLKQIDDLILLPIYPARELPIEGVTSEWLLNKIDLNSKRVLDKKDVVAYLQKQIKQIEVLLTVGAGDIDTIVLDIKKIIDNA